MSTMPLLPGYLTVEEAAPVIGVSIRRIHQYITRGQLKAVDLGKQYIIKEADARAFVRQPPGNPNLAKRKSSPRRR